MIQRKSVDATVVAKGRLEVRGGSLKVNRGQANKPSLDIGPETQVLGRNEACDLVLDDRKVSAVHAELVATERGVRVRDLGQSASIEIDAALLGAVDSSALVELVRAEGFLAAAVDPRGFRSGSMNERLKEPEKYR